MARHGTIRRIWIGIAVVAVVLLVVAANFAWRFAIERVNRWKCSSNLSALGQSLLLYSNEHQGFLPSDQGHFALDKDISAQVFICPDSGTSVSEDLPWNQLVTWVNAHSDYLFLAAGLNVQLNGANAAYIVMMCDKEENHHGEGMNLVFLDGHTDWMSVNDARRAILLSKSKIVTTQPTVSAPPDPQAIEH